MPGGVNDDPTPLPAALPTRQTRPSILMAQAAGLAAKAKSFGEGSASTGSIGAYPASAKRPSILVAQAAGLAAKAKSSDEGWASTRRVGAYPASAKRPSILVAQAASLATKAKNFDEGSASRGSVGACPPSAKRPSVIVALEAGLASRRREEIEHKEDKEEAPERDGSAGVPDSAMKHVEGLAGEKRAEFEAKNEAIREMNGLMAEFQENRPAGGGRAAAPQDRENNERDTMARTGGDALPGRGPVLMSAHGKQEEETISTVDEPVGECMSAGLDLEVCAQEDTDSLSQLEEENITAGFGTEVGATEHQLKCKYYGLNFSNGASKYPEPDTKPAVGPNAQKAETVDAGPSGNDPFFLAISEINDIVNTFCKEAVDELEQGVQDEMRAAHDPVDDRMAVPLRAEENVQEQQLKCKDSAPTSQDEADSHEANIPSLDVPSSFSREIPKIFGMRITGKVELCSNLEAEEAARGTAVDKEHGGEQPSSESISEAVFPTSHVKSENQEPQAGFQQATPASAATTSSVTSAYDAIVDSKDLCRGNESYREQVHKHNASENQEAQEEEHKEVVNPDEAHASTTHILTPTELDEGFPGTALQLPEPKHEEPMSQAGNHCLPVSTPPPASNHKEVASNTGNSQATTALPLEQKFALESPSKSSEKSAKSSALKRKPRKKIVHHLSPLKRQKLDEASKKHSLAKDPCRKSVQLYNGRSERVQLFRKCKNKFCKWEPRAHSRPSACERCWALASRREREEFIAKGRHLRIAKVTGGCPPACTLFPARLAGSPARESENLKPRKEAVRLCHRCFGDVHHVGIR